MAEYIRCIIKNVEPIRISDDSMSQKGFTKTLHYIPGTSIRGYVFNKISKNDFEKYKTELFSDRTSFTNAYMSLNKCGDMIELIPSPKGFVEDKKDAIKSDEDSDNRKEIKKNAERSSGDKNADLKKYCYISEGDASEEYIINYCDVLTNTDMKNRINVEISNDNTVFRNEYISINHYFTCYITVENIELREIIKNILSGEILLGNARSQGYGKCIVTSEYVDKLSYIQYLEKENLVDGCYMMLLSDTTMINENGEICGIDAKSLAKELNVDGLEVKSIGSPVINVRGHNRKWDSKIPSVLMYSKGSVFKLLYTGSISRATAEKMLTEGIGIRRNEGFGRIILFDKYEKIKWKNKIDYQVVKSDLFEQSINLERHEEDDATISIIARGYYKNILERCIEKYVVQNPISGLAVNSQLGNIEALAISNKYNPDTAINEIYAYIANYNSKLGSKKIQRSKAGSNRAFDIVKNVLENKDFLKLIGCEKQSVMGRQFNEVFSADEIKKMKLNLLVSMIRYNNKK